MLDETFYTYVIFYPDGVPCYVGKGRGKRWRKHIAGTSHRAELRNLFRKHRDNVPIVIVRDGLSELDAFATEAALIAAIGRRDLFTGPLLNRTDGGEGCAGRIVTQEHRVNLSQSHKGKKPSLANNLAVSLATKGKPRPQSVVDKMRAKAVAWAQSEAGKAHYAAVRERTNQRRAERGLRPIGVPIDYEESETRRIASIRAYYAQTTSKERAEKYGKSRRGKPHPLTGTTRTDDERAKIVAGLAAMSPEAEAARVAKIKNSKWITDGFDSRKLRENEELPDGWRYGRSLRNETSPRIGGRAPKI